MAFTSGLAHAGADDHHAVEITAKGYNRHQILYDLPGNDYYPREGDLWKYAMSSFGFPSSCITINDITGIAITERNNDGWNIDSIATFFIDEQGGQHIGSIDLDTNRWVDGDGAVLHRRFELTIVT